MSAAAVTNGSVSGTSLHQMSVTGMIILKKYYIVNGGYQGELSSPFTEVMACRPRLVVWMVDQQGRLGAIYLSLVSRLSVWT